MDNYQSMIYQSRDGVFSAWFEMQDSIQELDLIKVFILINKYYPNYQFKSDDQQAEKKRWEEYVLSDFQFRPSLFNNIYLACKFFIQNREEVFDLEPEDEGMEIIYGADDGSPIFGIQLYPYVFFDHNKEYFRDEETGILSFNVVDQSLAAKRNRENLTNLLKELEKLLNTDISFFQGGESVSSQSVYKYGIKSNAVLEGLSS